MRARDQAIGLLCAIPAGPFRMEHETVVLPAYQRSSAVNVPRVASAIHFPQGLCAYTAQLRAKTALQLQC